MDPESAAKSPRIRLTTPTLPLIFLPSLNDSKCSISFIYNEIRDFAVM